MTTIRRFVRSPWLLYGVSKATWYRWQEADPTFPRLRKLVEGGRAVGAFEDEIQAHMSARKAAAEPSA
jgi:predicted DNA-binding transcriptional regulator AlpA